MSGQLTPLPAQSRASGNPVGEYRNSEKIAGPPLSQGQTGTNSPRRLIFVVGAALALGYLIVLTGAYLGGHFLLDAQGRPIANDFVNVYAAGRLALGGEPAAAYDWTLHKAAEVRAVGHDFANY